MTSREARNLDLIRLTLGQKLTGLTRYVLGLGTSNDEYGHGVTELQFESLVLVVKPGPNEDFIIIDWGPFDQSGLDPRHWTRVDLGNDERFRRVLGRALKSVDCYSDGYEDVALVFQLEDTEQFSIVLCDNDLVLARALEPFQTDPERVEPQFRTRIAL